VVALLAINERQAATEWMSLSRRNESRVNACRAVRQLSQLDSAVLHYDWEKQWTALNVDEETIMILTAVIMFLPRTGSWNILQELSSC